MSRLTAARPSARRPRDLRSGERWTFGQRLKNSGYYRLIRALLAAADVASPGLLMAAGPVLGAATFRLAPRLRARAERRAALVLGPERATLVARQSFRRAGENLALMLLLRRPRVSALELLEVPAASRERLRRTLELGRGAVFVSAHLGPFELTAAAIAELGFAPAVVVRESYDPRLDPWVDQHRRLHGVEVIHRGRPGAARRIVKLLAAGRPVGFLPDLPARTRSIEVDFLGVRSELPVGPARIALRTGAPIVVGTLNRLEPARRPVGLTALFRLELESVHPDHGPAPSEADLMQAIMDTLGRAVLRSPEDWLWMS